MGNKKEKITAVSTALLVTFLWSTSFIIIKKGLEDIPPLTFAGLRYFFASAALLPVVLRRDKLDRIKKLKKNDMAFLILLGLVFYTATQGIQFIGLSLTSTVTVSLMLNFTPLAVVVLGIIFLKEKPGLIQVSGLVVFLAGILLYFRPVRNISDEKTGIIVMSFGVLANAVSAVLGRKINMKKESDPLIITFISMLTGSAVLTVLGFSINGIPSIRPTAWFYLLWLAVINTALAFTLWNISLRVLTAMESSIINGTMLIQIAVLSAVFLDTELSWQKIIPLFIVTAGAVLVQMKGRTGRAGR